MAEPIHPLRSSLWPLGLLYGAATAVRNWTFDAGLRRVHRLSVPVVSVGAHDTLFVIGFACAAWFTSG